MIQEYQIKILRLNTGEDIIGACFNDEANGSIDIESPMRVILKRAAPVGKTVLLMAPWLPIELIEENSASINYADIVTMINPNQQFVEYYTNTVTEYESIQVTSEEEDDEEDEEYDEDRMKEITEAIAESKKGKLH